MRKRFLIPILLFALILSVSAVSAAENNSDMSVASDEINVGDIKEVEDSPDILNSNEVKESEDADNGVQVLGENASSEISDGGANSSQNSSTPKVIKSVSKISASKLTGYTSFKSKFIVKLTAKGKPISGKRIVINLNNKNYNRITDANGEASLGVSLPKGTYTASFTYSGDSNTTSSKGSTIITIKESKKTVLTTDNYLNFRQGLRSIFYVKLTDKSGSPVKSKIVTFKVAGKTYNSKTNSKGYAKIYLSLKKGKYTIKCSFAKTQPYLGTSKNVKIVVRSKMDKGNGYWMWPMHMSSTSLKSLASRGTKHIFLLGDAVESYGKSYVTSWINQAHRYGMKVHLWIMVCYNGDWVSPVRDDGSFKYGFINKKINEAKYYARIKGVDGIHLDYMRYGGTAHKHINALASINYIVKKISYAVHAVNPNAIVSIAIMPEPSMMHYYYGQDVPTLSKYVDALLPMAYKGSYGKNTNWIKSVTQTFVKQSNGAQIWTGIQTYKSEDDTSRLSYANLMKDARSAMNGGAKGVVLFRIGLTYYLNFKAV